MNFSKAIMGVEGDRGKFSMSRVDDLKSLRSPCHFKSLTSIALDWLLIAFACYLISFSYYLIPFTVLIIGNRQRAISNLSHDASHINLFKIKSINDFITNVFCALPMFETIEGYRKSHMKHHQFLGDAEKDPDSLSHLKYGYNDSNPWKGNAYFNYLKLIFNKEALKSSFFGSIFSFERMDLLLVVTWWVIVGISIALLTSLSTSLIFIGTWFFSKLSSYHLIRIVAEFLDHSGLEQKSPMSFSRNLPHRGFLRFIFHPNCDTFHIVHHFYPKIPHYNLSSAHDILSLRHDYSFGHHCDSYFFGKHSAITCWVGDCTGNLK